MRELVRAMVDEAPRTRFTIVTTRRGAAGLVRDGWQSCTTVVALQADEGERIRRQIAEQVLLPRLARRRGFDLVHSLASVAPIFAGVPSVITLHDATFFTHKTFGLATTLGMRFVVSQAAARADQLITGAAVARDEVCRVMEIEPSRFAVVHHGLGRRPMVAASAPDEVRQRYRLAGERLVLCVAAKRPHKNQEVLVRAAPLLGEHTDVVLAGHPESYDAALRRVAAEVEARQVHFADYVSDADLEALWDLADCAVFPTLAEGFGLPVAEAMARGVPVACSDIPVLREVGGDVPCYFDPHDPRSVTAATERAIREAPVRVPAGKARAAQFSWQAAARATLGVYERATGKQLSGV
jgi:glycosyltransferase involved in cell wall biosynthesis